MRLGNNRTGLHRRLLAILCLVLISILMIEVIALRFNDPGLPADRMDEPPVSSQASPTDFNVAWLSPVAGYSAITERPLFHDSRRPHRPVATAPASPVQRVSQIDRAWKLTGIAINGEHKQALLQNRQDRTVTILAEGDTLAGWALVEVQLHGVVLEADGQTAELSLRTAENTQ